MKKLLALLLCVALCLPLIACQSSDTPSILPTFDDWLTDSGYQTTTIHNSDGTVTTTLTPPTSTESNPTTVPSVTPTTIPAPTAPVVPSAVPTTQSTATPTTVLTTIPTTNPTTAPTAKPTAAPTTNPTTAPTTKPTTAPTTKPTTAPTTSTSTATHTPLPYTERYLYKQLTQQEKGWYRKIDEAVNALQDTASLGVNLMENDRYNIYFIYMFDNPEHFYLGGRVSYSSSGNLYMSYSDGTTNCYRGGAVERLTDTMRANIRSRKAGFDAEVQRIVSGIPAELSPAKKELMIYDRLLIDMSYNQKAATNNIWDGVAQVNWTAYGGIIHKTGVCEAYAEAFQTLCYAVGINCTGVVGFANGGGHKWNAVEIEGQWYAVDVTFDDPLSSDGGEFSPGLANFHNYFNITSAKMLEDHSTDGSSYPGPNCTGTKYNYNSIK